MLPQGIKEYTPNVCSVSNTYILHRAIWSNWGCMCDLGSCNYTPQNSSPEYSLVEVVSESKIYQSRPYWPNLAGFKQFSLNLITVDQKYTQWGYLYLTKQERTKSRSTESIWLLAYHMAKPVKEIVGLIWLVLLNIQNRRQWATNLWIFQ